MPQIAIDDDNAIFFEHHEPQTGEPTFVFFNALTGDCGMWQTAIAPALEAHGAGTLVWNYRGQKDSPIDDDVELSAAQITADAVHLMREVGPSRPVFVGLSIGGLFAIDAHLEGPAAEALILVNTLRQAGPRLDWLNEAVYRAARTGGLALLRDLYGPLLFGEAWQRANRDKFLDDTPYEPLRASDPDARLLAAGRTADWNVAYEKLAGPGTVMCGLQDRLFFDPGVVDALALRLRDLERIDLPDAGHMIPVEAPDAVVEACRAMVPRIG